MGRECEMHGVRGCEALGHVECEGCGCGVCVVCAYVVGVWVWVVARTVECCCWLVSKAK